MVKLRFLGSFVLLATNFCLPAWADPFKVAEDEVGIKIETPLLEAVIRKRSSPGLATYAVTGIAAGSFLDKQTGFREAGYGLDIVDWIMEPGSDEAHRDQLDPELIYRFNNSYHGRRAKRSIEGPQICTRVKQLTPTLVRGDGFLGVRMQHRYTTAAPGKKTGSLWQQNIVFLPDKRYFISSDTITTVNQSDGMFLRIDMPGHIRQTKGDTFSEIYLSYHGRIPASEFDTNFPPEEKFHYLRGKNALPQRFIRAYKLRDPKTGKPGPWLAGMTLVPDVVSEAWCHQRDYVCLIEEFGGRPIEPGQSFSAAFVVGYFDSIEEMEQVYDQYAGHSRLEVAADGWKLIRDK